MARLLSPRRVLAAATLAALSACNMGADYERPALDVPDAFRGEDAGTPPQGHGPERSLGELGWWEMFGDEQLQVLLRRALENNYDLRLAAARVLEARARYGIVRADQLPQVDAGFSAGYNVESRNRVGGPPPGTDRSGSDFALFGSVSYEVDLWGRFRRGSEAAWARYLASEEARFAVHAALISDVAAAWFDLCALGEELALTKRTVESRSRQRDLVQIRRDGGVASGVDLAQAESLLAQATARLPEFERLLEQRQNQICFLLGENPRPIEPGLALGEQAPLPELPVGLPSALVDRRPDVRLAEQELVAANADVGVAKALLFPQIPLIASGGVASEDLSDLFDAGSSIASLAGSVLQPIFAGGRLQANVEASEARHEQLVLDYRRTVLQSLREVADALVEWRKTRASRGERETLVRALRDYARLANDRYRGGVTSYLEVLDAEQQLFDAEIVLTFVRRDERTAYVQLYKALGGGWQSEPRPEAEGGTREEAEAR